MADQSPAGAAQAAPADPADRAPFEGHEGRECGEHRTVGPHRAWCFNDSEWCYPAAPCRGCELPAMRAALAAADQLHTRLTALADALDHDAASYAAARDHLAASDHQASVSAHVRWQMATDAAHRLRALLEET